MVNFSIAADSKMVEKAMSIAEYIFDNLITSDDRFSLWSYTSNSNQLVSLCYKNISTVDYIRDQINKFCDKEYYKDAIDLFSSASNLIKAAESGYEYLEKKKGTSNREKWIIILTDDISNEEAKFIREFNIKERIFENCDSTHLIIIKTIKNPHNENDISDKLNFNKSGVIEADKIESLKKKMTIMGYITDEILFAQEKYDNYNKN
jgi:hypothetical protein